MNIEKIKEHYDHVCEKHKYFFDMITDEACTVLLCDIYETIQAYKYGDTEAAVEECYDAIAVLLRMIDVLEGRQKLGKPEEGGAK